MANRSTTVSRRQFEAQMERAEQTNASTPQRYKLKLFLLALLGYGVLFGTLFLLVGLIAGGLWAAFASTAVLFILLKSKLIFPLVIIVWIILRALWVRMPQPDGYRLERKAFFSLHDELDDLRKHLHTPRIHRVLLTDAFNAGITQAPRLGVFGWYRNTLILGLPLLLALTPDQARAVVAHELGHLSGNHSRFNGWIYRVRESWTRIMMVFDGSPHWAAGLLRKFFDWYAPYFSAYSFVLARANEYEADTVSAELTSPSIAAQALVNTQYYGDCLSDQFWNSLIERADRQPDPVQDPYDRLAHFLSNDAFREGVDSDRFAQLLDRATEHTDTHPALRDRLVSMAGETPEPTEISENAAEAWLGDHYTSVLADLNQAWMERNKTPWRQRHDYAQDSLKQLTEIRSKPVESLTLEERWNLAAWTEAFVPDVDPLPLYRNYREAAPEDPGVNYAIGRILLARKDREGIGYLEKATSKRILAIDACDLAVKYLRESGDKEEADRWLLRGERYIDLERRAVEERQTVTAHDRFLLPELPEAWLDHLAEQLSRTGKIRRAWIAIKQVELFPDEPVYILVFDISGFTNANKIARHLADTIEVPGPTVFICKRGESKKITKRAIEQGLTLLPVKKEQ